jgi:predicted neuraminidase
MKLFKGIVRFVQKPAVIVAFLGLMFNQVGYAQSSQAILRSELIFPIQSLHVHGSSLVELPNGELLVAWFEGSGERTADDVKVMGARLKKGSKTWSAPFEMADTPYLPDCNPVLFLANNKLFLVWIAVQANRWEQSVLRLKSTANFEGDGAPNWTWQDNILLKPTDAFADEVAKRLKELPDPGHGWAEYAPKYDRMVIEASQDLRKRSFGWMTRIKPLILGNRILLPLYSDGLNMSLVAVSEDGGGSWLPSLPIVGRGPIQPTLLPKKDGTLVAYMRDSGDAPSRVQMSESKDGGQSWTVSRKTAIPSGASVDAVVLPDGRWALLLNDVEDGRYRFTLLISEDEGANWHTGQVLELDKDRKGRYSYPAMILGKDGLLHITYSYHQTGEQKSIKYTVIDPKKISVK